MSQSTAELQIPNVPLQAETTPTPPIAVTIPPIQPQHPTPALRRYYTAEAIAQKKSCFTVNLKFCNFADNVEQETKYKKKKKQTNLESLSVVIHIPIFSTIAIMFLLFLAGCQLIEFEQSVIAVTTTPPATNLIPNNQSLQGVENHRIDIYKKYSSKDYEDILSDQTLPQETRNTLIAEMATIQGRDTQWAMPAPY